MSYPTVGTVLQKTYGIVLLLLGLNAAIFDLQHLWRLYSPFYKGLYSFGIYLTYFGFRIWDPWSDVVILASTLTWAVASWILFFNLSSQRTWVVISGVTLIIVITGLLG